MRVLVSAISRPGASSGWLISAAAAEPAARFQFARAERVHEDQHAEFLALGPERMEPRVGQVLAGDAPADADPAEAEPLDRIFDLFRGEFGVLQGCCREGDETVGAGRAEFHQRLVLQLDQFSRGIAPGAVPVRVDAQGLDVDALGVHRRDAGAGVVHQQSRRLERMVDQLRGRRDDAVGVHVDGLDPFAVDDDLAPARMGMVVRGRCYAGHGAADEGDAG